MTSYIPDWRTKTRGGANGAIVTPTSGAPNVPVVLQRRAAAQRTRVVPVLPLTMTNRPINASTSMGPQSANPADKRSASPDKSKPGSTSLVALQVEDKPKSAVERDAGAASPVTGKEIPAQPVPVVLAKSVATQTESDGRQDGQTETVRTLEAKLVALGFESKHLRTSRDQARKLYDGSDRALAGLRKAVSAAAIHLRSVSEAMAADDAVAADPALRDKQHAVNKALAAAMTLLSQPVLASEGSVTDLEASLRNALRDIVRLKAESEPLQTTIALQREELQGVKQTLATRDTELAALGAKLDQAEQQITDDFERYGDVIRAQNDGADQASAQLALYEKMFAEQNQNAEKANMEIDKGASESLRQQADIKRLTQSLETTQKELTDQKRLNVLLMAKLDKPVPKPKSGKPADDTASDASAQKP